jgi:hypothetical protein
LNRKGLLMSDSNTSTNAATTQHQKTLEAALAYADQGLSVFPCNRDKRPMVTGGFKAATTDKDEIQRMWDERGDVPCVAMATGKASGCITLDVDTDEGKRGDESLKRLEDNYGPLPETSSFRTGGGGRQYILRCPEGVEIRNSAGKLGEGLDVRGEGGYAILPPSLSFKGEYIPEKGGESQMPPSGLWTYLWRITRARRRMGVILPLMMTGYWLSPMGQGMTPSLGKHQVSVLGGIPWKPQWKPSEYLPMSVPNTLMARTVLIGRLRR